MSNFEKDEIRRKVRERYAAVALEKDSGCGCSSSSCCSPQSSSAQQSAKLGYSQKDLKAVPEGANLGLGCGNPQAIARLKKGETVIDLGAGGGFDCFLAAKQVGKTGKVIGVDMTPEMVAKARKNSEKGKYLNVDFRLGEIEHLPVADNTAHVILSNCVINLSPDKEQVYSEAYRVLKAGGRLAISDVITVKTIPKNIRNDTEKISGCVAGALSFHQLTRILEKIGFKNIVINVKEESREFIKEWFPGSGLEKYVRSAEICGIKKQKGKN